MFGTCGNCKYWEKHDCLLRRSFMGDCTFPTPISVVKNPVADNLEGCPMWERKLTAKEEKTLNNNDWR